MAQAPPMLRDDQVCPRCGALTSPQLPRCRQCGRYLHGTQAEGWLVENLLPKRFSGSPGTGLVALYCMLYYLLMVLLAGPSSLAGFRPLAILQLGATTSTEVQDGEVWRFVISVFAHGSLLHIVFNLYALSVVGPLVEELHDRKRVLVFFVLTGVVSMVGSYAVRVHLMGYGYFPGSVGASGAVSGLLGVAWYESRRVGSPARSLHEAMTRWVVILLLWGFLPRVDWAAHLVGLLAGAAVAWVVPSGPPGRRWQYRAWTGAAVAAIVLVLGSTSATLLSARDQPYRLANDAAPRRFLFLTIEPGARWDESGQYRAYQRCLEEANQAFARREQLPEALEACELAIRAIPHEPTAHQLLARLLERDGQSARADRQEAIARRLFGR